MLVEERSDCHESSCFQPVQVESRLRTSDLLGKRREPVEGDICLNVVVGLLSWNANESDRHTRLTDPSGTNCNKPGSSLTGVDGV